MYERISPREDWPTLQRVEELTNPRVQERRLLTGLNRVDEASPQLQNWNHAPFTYLNPEGTWLLDPFIGALELSDSLQTALAASIRRRELFLSRTGEPPLNLDMRVLCTNVRGDFADLRTMDPSLTQSARWRIGEEALKSGAHGALFASPYRRASTCLAVFNGEVLQRSLQAEHFKFVWDGANIRSVYSFSDGATLVPEEVFGEKSIDRAA
ncbi:RES family NAD+ phosphorylase [Sphingomonas sp. ASV193]|uniref:RES family NAD+ phosphorylase n=1 Tax=Sphingomonas sp. ASV193 TaxID=3144405 RepID=UPI0032E8AC0A